MRQAKRIGGGACKTTGTVVAPTQEGDGAMDARSSAAVKQR